MAEDFAYWASRACDRIRGKENSDSAWFSKVGQSAEPHSCEVCGAMVPLKSSMSIGNGTFVADPTEADRALLILGLRPLGVNGRAWDIRRARLREAINAARVEGRGEALRQAGKDYFGMKDELLAAEAECAKLRAENEKRKGHRGCDALVIQAQEGEKRAIGKLETAEAELSKLREENLDIRRYNNKLHGLTTAQACEVTKLREDRDRLAGLLKQAKLVAQDSIDRHMDEWPSAVPSLMGRLREITKLEAK